MNTLADIETRVLEIRRTRPVDAVAAADQLLVLAERVMAHWLHNKGLVPTLAEAEGFRLLALHRQGCKGDPSFNACRESCRELVYYRNLLHAEPEHPEVNARVAMACAVTLHLCLFIGGKLQDPELGDFCCSSRPLHAAPA
jgi:hypothetical protein